MRTDDDRDKREKGLTGTRPRARFLAGFRFPSGKPFHVAGLGLNSVDHLCLVPHFPRYDSKLKMLDFDRQGGGQAATAMVACRRLGLTSRYLGKTGGDTLGQFSRESLAKAGVDTGGIKQVPGARNQLAFILIDQSTGERTIIWERDRRLAMLPSEVSRDIVCSASVLLVDGHDAAACLQAARYAREAGMLVVMDAEGISEETDELVSAVDILIGERHFPERFTGSSDTGKALVAISRRGPLIAGVTIGREGALFYWDGNYYHAPAYTVPCRDTTGAGDVFHAGFIRALFENWDIEQCLDFANAVAAMKCRELGGRRGIPGFAEALAFMKPHGVRP